MEINREVYFSIACKDRAGALATVVAHLMESEVAMSGVWGFGTGQGRARIIAVPREVERFKSVASDAGWGITEGVCYRIEGEDTHGALADILSSVAREKVNLHAVDAMALDGHFGCYLWAEDEDIETIAQVLGLSTPHA